MGPCIYCKEMIYHEWIADRGYHRECHENHLLNVNSAHAQANLMAQRIQTHLHKADKRRERRKEIRDIKKGKVTA